MGTIAEKLEYLDGTREKILTETNRLGVGLTEQDKFRDYAKGLHDGYVDVLNNGTDILYDNMEKVSGSGSDITLENTEEAPMRSDLEGDTYQETTTGKNLFDKNNIVYGKSWNDGTDTKRARGEIKDRPNQDITISVKNISNLDFVRLVLTNDNFSANFVAHTFTNNDSYTLTPNYNTQLTKYEIEIQKTNISSTDLENVEIQIEYGNQATTYEEYTGGQPSPNPDYPQPVNVVSGRQEVSVVGKNLFDKTNYPMEQGSFNYNTNANQTSDNRIRSPFFAIQPNTTYTLSCNEEIGEFAVIYKQSDASTIIAGISENTTNKYYTFTTPSNAYFMRFRIGSATYVKTYTTDYEIQLEQNSTASEYEEYKGQSYEINLGKNLLDTQYYENGSIDGSTGQNVSFSYNARGSNYIPVEPNTTYTFSVNTNCSNLRLSEYTSSKTNIQRDVVATVSSITITTTANTYFVRWSLNYNNSTELTQEIISSLQLQLEKGNATSYAPYKTPIELCKINTYKDMIFRGKGNQLFDKDNANILNAIINGTNGTITGFNTCRTAYIQCKPNTTYTISKILSARFVVGTCVSTPATGVICNVYRANNTGTSITITSGASDKYLAVFYYLSSADTLTEEEIRNSIMINEGSTALPYEPYNSKGKWLLHKEIGKVVLNGSEYWGKRNDGDGSTTITFQINGAFGSFGANSEYCNRFVYEQSSSSGNEGIGIGSEKNTAYIQIKRSRLSSLDVAGFTSWLSINNTIVYYILATPTTTEITDTELINQLEEFYNAKSNKDVTYISVTSEDLPAILNVIAIKKYE